MGLPKAIARLKRIPPEAGPILGDKLQTLKALGYGTANGSAVSTLNSLRQYGLLEKEGADYKVGNLGTSILREPPDSRALTEAALRPDVFKALEARFGPGVIRGNGAEAFLSSIGFTRAAIRIVIRSHNETFMVKSAASPNGDAVEKCAETNADSDGERQTLLAKAKQRRSQLVKSLEDVETFIRVLSEFDAATS